jgi:DNA replicative helicase MCM subunit Mcm2 (Cdc46/Mcm family)
LILQEFLRKYFTSLSREIPTMLHRPATLMSLLRLATASAKLRLQPEVQMYPDCILAIWIVETTVPLKVTDHMLASS